MCPPVIKHGDGKSPSKDHVSKQPVVSVDFPASHGWWHRRVAPSCPNSSLTNHHSPVISIYFWWFKTSIDDGDQQGRFSPSCQRPHLSPVSASPQKLNDYWSPNVWVHRHFWAKPKINIAGYKYIYIYKHWYIYIYTHIYIYIYYRFLEDIPIDSFLHSQWNSKKCVGSQFSAGDSSIFWVPPLFPKKT